MGADVTDIQMRELAERIKGLREACEVSAEDMAADIGVDLATYERWETLADDVPISAIRSEERRVGKECM